MLHFGQSTKQVSSKIEKIEINYKGKKVNGRKLTVSSELSIDIDNAWNEVQKSSLLEFICKGKIKFKPVNSNFPKHWKSDMEVKVKLLVYGFIPFGGIHTLKLVEIIPEKHTVLSNEKNSIVKVWNHRIEMVKLNENLTKYTDEIELYAGFLTSFVVKWAETFYNYRQRRWSIVVEKIKNEAQQRI